MPCEGVGDNMANMISANSARSSSLASTPRVSLRMVSYNHESYVEEAIISAVNQNYPNLSIIIVDNGSEDRSSCIIKSLANDYQFEYVIQENKGLPSALNMCFEMDPTADYYFSIAADDLLEPNAIAGLVSKMEKEPQFGACYGRVQIMDGSGRISHEMNNDKVEGFLREAVLTSKVKIPFTWMLIRNEALLRAGGYDEHMPLEDSDMFERLSRTTSFGFYDGFIVRYRKHPGGSTRRSRWIYDHSRKILQRLEHEPFYNEARKQMHLNWFLILASCDRQEAVKYLPSAARRPWDRRSVAGVMYMIGLHDLVRWGKGVRRRLSNIRR